MTEGLVLPNIDIGLSIKVFELIVTSIFIIFSLLTLRQVSIMNKSVITALAPEIKIAALVQLVASTVVFFLILVI